MHLRCTLTVQMPTCRYVGNRFLKRKVVHHHTSEQSVEWLYAFDVHCNSFVPMFMLLYGAHQTVFAHTGLGADEMTLHDDHAHGYAFMYGYVQALSALVTACGCMCIQSALAWLGSMIPHIGRSVQCVNSSCRHFYFGEAL